MTSLTGERSRKQDSVAVTFTRSEFVVQIQILACTAVSAVLLVPGMLSHLFSRNSHETFNILSNLFINLSI